ncbi:MAG: hypothetical protein WKF67_12230 [Rubrobacteraceae bacterium]
MPYYVLTRGEGELYAMNMALSEDEARRYGHEGEMVVVTAVFVWGREEQLKRFQQFLSATQHESDTPFRGLVEDMRAGRVDALALSADQLRDRLRSYQATAYVAVDPGQDQRVQRIEEFRVGLST